MTEPLVSCIRRISAVALVVVLSGCSQQLYEDLTEQEANEMTAVLRLEDIDAGKVSLKDKKWGVTVPPGDFAQAVMILRDRNMPTFGYEGLGKMFRKVSLMVTPTEERARMMHALSEELRLTLRQIEGVLDVRVHVVIPPRDVLSESQKPSAASVLLKVRPGIDMSGQINEIRQLVANSVEGIAPASVSVLAVPSSNPLRQSAPALGSSGLRVASLAFAGVGLILLVIWFGGKLGLWAALQRRLRARWQEAKIKAGVANDPQV